MRKQRADVATTQRVWTLYDAEAGGVRPAILPGPHAGLRLSEATAIRVEAVDFTMGVGSPARQWLEEPLKPDASRTPIPIPKGDGAPPAEAIQLGDGRFPPSDQWGNPAGPWTIERAIRACLQPAGLTNDSGSTTSGTPRPRRFSIPTVTSGPTVTAPPEPRWRRCIASEVQAVCDGSSVRGQRVGHSGASRTQAMNGRCSWRSHSQ